MVFTFKAQYIGKYPIIDVFHIFAHTLNFVFMK